MKCAAGREEEEDKRSMEDRSDGKCLNSIRHSDRLSLGISASPASFIWYRILPHSYVLFLFRGMFFHLSRVS